MFFYLLMIVEVYILYNWIFFIVYIFELNSVIVIYNLKYGKNNVLSFQFQNYIVVNKMWYFFRVCVYLILFGYRNSQYGIYLIG